MKQEMIGSVPGNVLGMLADLMHKIQHGVRTPDQLDRFLKGQNPFAVLFTMVVDYASDRWKSINKALYAFVNDSLTAADFLIRGTGTGEVTYDYVTFDHEPTTQEVFDEVERCGDLRMPDRAEAETFLEKNPEERKQAPVVALCGSVAERESRRFVAYVRAHTGGVDLGWRWIGDCWFRHSRFLVVRM